MILCVCLNPALQRTLAFKSLSLRRVNRAVSARQSVGGKGVNVSRVLTSLGADGKLLLPLGGVRGREIRRLLRREGLSFRAVDVSGETRICTTLVDAGSSSVTELVEESVPFSGAEVRSVQKAFDALLPRVRLVVLSGTAPAGFPADIYGRWIAMARKRGIPVLLDAAEPWARPGLEAKPWFFRANWGEMEAVLGRPCRRTDAAAALEALCGRGACNALISLDGPAAVARADGRFYRLSCPRLKTVNPIGSGDAMAAGLAAAHIRDRSMPEILRLAMACGAANVLTPTAGTVRPSDVRRLTRSVGIRPG